MIFPQIRCYHAGAKIPPHSFFILCKGSNAGKPGFKPWTNSFLVVCPHQEYFDFFFWLIHGLHLSGKFKVRHRGSAIPFINLVDVQDTIRELASTVHVDWSRFREIVNSLDKLNKFKTSLQQQILATDQLQRCLIQKYFLDIRNTPK